MKIPEEQVERIKELGYTDVEARFLYIVTKTRNVMHGIFAHACRHDWLRNNPISLVRQSAKREKMPAVLDAEELKKLLTELQNPARAMVFLTAATGLRVSEALDLKWSGVDFGTGGINLSRAVVHQHVGEVKTEAS